MRRGAIVPSQKVPNGKAKGAPKSRGWFARNGTEPGTAIAEQMLAIPSIAARPFFSSDSRYSASCSGESLSAPRPQ